MNVPIEDLKNDPLVRLIASVSGVSVDELVKAIQDKEASDSNKNANTSANKEDLEPDMDTTYPLTQDELVFIVNLVKEVFAESAKYEELGINIWDTRFSALLWYIIRILLSVIYDKDFLECFEAQDFNKNDTKTITNNLIHCLEQND